MTRSVTLASAVTLLAVVAAACSSPGNVQSACNITGSYRIHYAIHSGAPATCVAPADGIQKVTPGSDAGPSCSTQGPATCTLTLNCKFDMGGVTEATTGSITFGQNGSSGAGAIGIRNTSDADGGVLSDCTFDVTYTRQ